MIQYGSEYFLPSLSPPKIPVAPKRKPKAKAKARSKLPTCCVFPLVVHNCRVSCFQAAPVEAEGTEQENLDGVWVAVKELKLSDHNGFI